MIKIYIENKKEWKIVVFLIGFIAGYFASTLGIVGNSTNTLTNDIETNIVQSVSLK